MSTIYQSGPSESKTHVFIIGVGSYRHLDGGAGPRFDALPFGQLTSPPVSARAVTNWFLTAYNNPQAPLGSVELLISDGPPATSYQLPGGRSVPVDCAVMAKIKSACADWFNRCDAAPTNVAVFYFCGHGLAKGLSTALLAEDFGADRLRPLENAIDLEATHLGMAGCKAGQQCYFVDACRNPTPALAVLHAKATALVDGVPEQQAPRNAPIFYATAAGQVAWALGPSQVSRFTEALLLSLGGLGADNPQGQWMVDTFSLGKALAETLKQSNRNPEVPRQNVRVGGEDGGFDLHLLSNAPEVPVRIGCLPAAATSQAVLAVQSSSVQKRRVPEPGDWSLKLPAAPYTVSASFPTGAYRNGTDSLVVHPPYREKRLSVQP